MEEETESYFNLYILNNFVYIMSKNIKVADDVFEKVMERKGDLIKKEKRHVSDSEVVERLLERLEECEKGEIEKGKGK